MERVGSFGGVEIRSNEFLQDDQIAIISAGRVIAMGPLNALKTLPPGAALAMSEELFRQLGAQSPPITLSRVEERRLQAVRLALPKLD